MRELLLQQRGRFVIRLLEGRAANPLNRRIFILTVEDRSIGDQQTHHKVGRASDASSATTNSNTRRWAVYTGLAGHFAEDELLAVLALWESKYTDKPPFALNEFLGEVASVTERKLERARLYRELVGALNGPLSDLLPDPVPQLRRWRQQAGGGP